MSWDGSAKKKERIKRVSIRSYEPDLDLDPKRGGRQHQSDTEGMSAKG